MTEPSPPPTRVGLLGGSFNPAHDGHLYISELALDRLGLDEVWWLVSPQNPLKPVAGMAAFAERLRSARTVGGHPKIRVRDLERSLGTRFTIDTLRALKIRYPGVRFVWLMGADNLLQMPRWQGWRAIFRAVPIAVFARPSYSSRARSGRAARRFRRHRIPAFRASGLADMRPPAWVFMRHKPHGASASRIRAGRPTD